MPYISDLQFFHGLDNNPEYEPEKLRREVEQEKEEDKKNKKEKKSENFSNEMVDNYQKTIKLVGGFSLKKEFKDDKVEAEIIRSRKETILNLLRKILSDIDKYTSRIQSLQLSRSAEYDDIKSYQDTIGSSDAARRSIHNILVNDIKLAIRLINVSFNQDFPEAERVKEEKKYTDRRGYSEEQLKEALAEREFVSFPYGQGTFIDWQHCPKDPGQEREFIKNWAITFYGDLTKLKDDFDQEIKKTPR